MRGGAISPKGRDQFSHEALGQLSQGQRRTGPGCGDIWVWFNCFLWFMCLSYEKCPFLIFWIVCGRLSVFAPIWENWRNRIFLCGSYVLVKGDPSPWSGSLSLSGVLASQKFGDTSFQPAPGSHDFRGYGHGPVMRVQPQLCHSLARVWSDLPCQLPPLRGCEHCPRWITTWTCDSAQEMGAAVTAV